MSIGEEKVLQLSTRFVEKDDLLEGGKRQFFVVNGDQNSVGVLERAIKTFRRESGLNINVTRPDPFRVAISTPTEHDQTVAYAMLKAARNITRDPKMTFGLETIIDDLQARDEKDGFSLG